MPIEAPAVWRRQPLRACRRALSLVPGFPLRIPAPPSTLSSRPTPVSAWPAARAVSALLPGPRPQSAPVAVPRRPLGHPPRRGWPAQPLGLVSTTRTRHNCNCQWATPRTHALRWKPLDRAVPGCMPLAAVSRLPASVRGRRSARLSGIPASGAIHLLGARALYISGLLHPAFTPDNSRQTTLRLAR